MKSKEVIGGRFEVEGLAGAGGMGQVFRARDLLSGSVSALKTITVQNREGEERFCREAQLLAQVRHPGLVRYVAHGTHEGAPFLVMEWLEGEDLCDRLRRSRAPTNPGLALDELLSLGRRLAGALGELHQRGVVHRDVKPSNVYLVDGSPHQGKLLDLGVAHTEHSGVKLTAQGELVGSPAYMAPEQVEGSTLVGPTADVWGLGCVLYECLTGRPPFQKGEVRGLLASIVLDDPAPPRELRADTPPELEGIVLKMLQKRAEDRYADGGEVLDALCHVSASGLPREVGEGERTWRSNHRHAAERSRPSLTSAETRVACVLLVKLEASTDLSSCLSPSSELMRIVEVLGCTLRRTADQPDRLVVIPPQSETPKEQACSLARVALSVRRQQPLHAFMLATGRAQETGELSVAELVEKAAERLACVQPGRIAVDEEFGAFLDSRFEMRTEAGAFSLERELYAEGVRTLLGKVTPWVGRQREINFLHDTYRECVDEGEARALLVTAAAGVGKSRLRHEFVEELKQRAAEPALVIHCQGDALSAGSPFVMLRPAICRSAGVLDGEDLATRRQKLSTRVRRHVPQEQAGRIEVFLGEMVGVPFDDTSDEALRAAREDPSLLRESMRGAFVDWLRAETTQGPVLVVLEDLHWGDLPSVQYLDTALAVLSDRSLMILSLARPEVHARYPGLWQRHNILELRLHRLGKRASAELVRDVLGEQCDESTTRMIVDKADGNAFYLEELIRFAAEGRLGVVPENVLGMVQTRLSQLDQEARRVLRAASVFGEVFWENGVCTLLGESTSPRGQATFSVAEWLSHLCDLELVRTRPSSRLPDQREYQFRHALVHEAAREMLTEGDSRLGHGLAGEWLVDAGEQDSLVLAEHFSRGAQPEQAITWFGRAAEQAFEGSDFSSTQDSCERGVGLGAQGAALGALRGLQAQAAYWSSDYETSRRCGQDALAHQQLGSQEWFRSLGCSLVAAARLGDAPLVNQLFERALDAACIPGAEGAQLACLCRGTFQLIFGARLQEADIALARIDEIAGDLCGLDVLTTAQVHHVRGVRAAHRGDVAHFLEHLEAAVAAFETAGDLRNVCLERTTLAWCHAELGDVAVARTMCEQSLAQCMHQGAGQALTYAKVNLGYILSLCPGFRLESRETLLSAISECESACNLRLEGWARAHLSSVEHEAKRFEESLQQAEWASERLAATPGLQAWAFACQARALLELGQLGEAHKLAVQATTIQQELGGLLQGDALVPWVLAACLRAVGALGESMAAIEQARQRIERRADGLPLKWQESYRQLPDSTRTLQLATKWPATPS